MDCLTSKLNTKICGTFVPISNGLINFDIFLKCVMKIKINENICDNIGIINYG
jgi:hypothetical protein